MTNIVMLCRDRYRLTMQAIGSIRRYTKSGEYNLTLIDDDSTDFRIAAELRDQAQHSPKDTTAIRVTSGRHCLGALKNLGITHSRYTFGKGDFLCVLDNDVCVFDGWLDTLIEKYDPRVFAVLGGVRHPFHQSTEMIGGVSVVDAVAGYCHFMSWGAVEDLMKDLTSRGYRDLYATDASGIGQSEDFELCQQAAARGAKVGYVNPPVMAHCGITNSEGKLIAGADQIEAVPGVLYL